MEPKIAAEATTKAWKERAHWFGKHTSCVDNEGQRPERSLDQERLPSSETTDGRVLEQRLVQESPSFEDDSEAAGGSNGRGGTQLAAKRRAPEARSLRHAPKDFVSPFQVTGEAHADPWFVQAQREVRNRNSKEAG